MPSQSNSDQISVPMAAVDAGEMRPVGVVTAIGVRRPKTTSIDIFLELIERCSRTREQIAMRAATRALSQ